MDDFSVKTYFQKTIKPGSESNFRDKIPIIK